MREIPAILLMGPTASGKSVLALSLAERYGGEIVSVDSAQVYRGMDIGTAKPDAGTRERVRHHLLDLIVRRKRILQLSSGATRSRRSPKRAPAIACRSSAAAPCCTSGR